MRPYLVSDVGLYSSRRTCWLDTWVGRTGKLRLATPAQGGWCVAVRSLLSGRPPACLRGLGPSWCLTRLPTMRMRCMCRGRFSGECLRSRDRCADPGVKRELDDATAFPLFTVFLPKFRCLPNRGSFHSGATLALANNYPPAANSSMGCQSAADKKSGWFERRWRFQCSTLNRVVLACFFRYW
jgi:hypothetical protein